MKFEKTEVWGFEHAIRGMRNPKESWGKSDSVFQGEQYKTGDIVSETVIGANDMALMQTLIRAGSEHRKFMRQIFVSVDITAPAGYWWTEFDTYKVGTVANSTSKMHKLASKPITMECFEMDDYSDVQLHCYPGVGTIDSKKMWSEWIDYCEKLRLAYIATGDIAYWKELIRALPESWLQKRTITMNYENLLGMCSKGQRRYHKLTEWSESFISWARTLPYAQELIFIDEVEK